MSLCTATIKLNTLEVLKCINSLKVYMKVNDILSSNNEELNVSLNNEGLKKLLIDFENIYEDMLEKQDMGVNNEYILEEDKEFPRQPNKE
tara:strand:+ start:230 stop:499 length:270 start_codon:yes stop_codon:yes gene_type:complete